jgi:hypothetical protein
MEFLHTSTFLWHSLIYCGLFVLILVPVGFVNNRIMLHSYPKAIQAMVPPKTAAERRQTFIFALPMLCVLIGFPAFASWTYNSPSPTFLNLFTYMWAIMLVGNIFDLLILDWLIFCSISPDFMKIKGTEKSPAYKDYMFHFLGSLKGIVITAVMSAAATGVIRLLAV